MELLNHILLASGLLATTYGWGEYNCGDIGKPRPCEAGAVTASGLEFNPNKAMIAIAAPTRMRLRKPILVGIKLADTNSECVNVLLADKMNPRYIGKRGFDLTPKAVELVTQRKPHAGWADRIEVCWYVDSAKLKHIPVSKPMCKRKHYETNLHPLAITSSRCLRDDCKSELRWRPLR